MRRIQHSLHAITRTALALIVFALCSCAHSPRGTTSATNARPEHAPGVQRVQFTPAAPRQQCEHPSAVDHCPTCPVYPPAFAGQFPTMPPGWPYDPKRLAEMFPDEYICDGGDRADPVHFDDFNRLGLDTEDAVVEYTDHRGRRHVKPTNKVCVYAPRFGAVRTIISPSADYSVGKLAGIHKQDNSVAMRTRTATVNHSRRLGPDGIRVRSRASGLDAEAPAASAKQLTLAGLNDKLLNIYQNLHFLASGKFVRTEEAFLASRIQAAAVWTRKSYPIIAAKVDGVQEVQVEFKAQEKVGVDDKHKTLGRLRIVKMADLKTAKPGDVITFTIRYDNLGDKAVDFVRIIDNLTPRLEYVDESATSDRPGRIDMEDNGEGSLVLKFVFDDPLPGKRGGVVTFQAKVR